MALSPTSLLLLTLLSTIPAALAIRPSAGGDSLIAKACNGTSSLSTPACVDALRSSAESPRRVAELAYLYLVKVGEELSKEFDGAVAAAAGKGEATRQCLSTLQANLKMYNRPVSRFTPDQGEAKFAEAKANLNELLRAPSDSGVSCTDEDMDKEPIVKKEYAYEDMVQLTLELMNKASETQDGEKKKDPEEMKAAVDEFEETENRKREDEGAALIRDTAGKDPLVKACADVIAPTDVITCVAVFKAAAAEAAAAKANPRRLAELAFQHLLKSAKELAPEMQRAAAEAKGKPGELPACLQAYDDRMNNFMSNITGLTPEESDAKLIEAYEKLRSLRGTEDVPAYHCTVKDLTDNPIPKKFGEFEKALVLTMYIMSDAAPSSPSKAPKA